MSDASTTFERASKLISSTPPRSAAATKVRGANRFDETAPALGVQWTPQADGRSSMIFGDVELERRGMPKVALRRLLHRVASRSALTQNRRRLLAWPHTLRQRRLVLLHASQSKVAPQSSSSTPHKRGAVLSSSTRNGRQPQHPPSSPSVLWTSPRLSPQTPKAYPQSISTRRQR